MYERSAIVLEKYFEEILGFNKENSIKENYKNYEKIIKETKEYQKILEEEERVIKKFDEVVKEIEEIQKRQEKLHNNNIEMEDERNRLFSDLGENPSSLDQRLEKIEENLEENNEEIKDLRQRYVKALVIFMERQKERNKWTRTHRTAEANYLESVENANKIFSEISEKDVAKIKKFVKESQEATEQEIIEIMIKNGKNEKVPFNYEIIENAVKIRMDIAQKEAEIYLNIYEKTKKLLIDLNNETVKLKKSEKLLRDSSVKIAFLTAKKEYIVDFLDNERMSVMYGKRAHNQLMEEACKNFELDIKQIDNLYELIIRETTSKSTKKAYKELYNKTYLKNIEEKEKDFEKEVTNIKINTGTVINSNYWRIEGIKNIYNVFNEEIEEKFEKDLSEFKLEEHKTTEKEELEPEKVSIKSNSKKDLKSNNEEPEEDFDFEYDNEKYSEDINSEYQEDEEEEEDIYEFNFDEDDDFDYEDEEEEPDEEFDFDDEEEEDYEEFDEDDDEYDEDYDEDYNENEKNFDFYDEDEEIIEDKIDKIIKNSRKGTINTKNKKEKGLFGKLFKK